MELKGGNGGLAAGGPGRMGGKRRRRGAGGAAGGRDFACATAGKAARLAEEPGRMAHYTGAGAKWKRTARCTGRQCQEVIRLDAALAERTAERARISERCAQLRPWTKDRNAAGRAYNQAHGLPGGQRDGAMDGGRAVAGHLETTAAHGRAVRTDGPGAAGAYAGGSGVP